jgi:endonuclease/exonuclease/phosphatase family metal-dependent hydrolase
MSAGVADILCLQEVSVGFGELAPDAAGDQVAALSRLPVLDVVAYALPRPADAAVMNM